MGAGIAAGTGGTDFLHHPRMRRAVGAEEEAWIATGSHFHQRRAVGFALEHRQTVPVRPQAAREDGVAVVDQVLRRDGRAQQPGRRGVGLHVFGGLPGGDVLEHHLQRGQLRAQRDHHPVDEHGLAVEYIDARIRHLAMHQQRQARFGHGFQHRHHTVDGAHAGVRIGGGPGRIELDGRHHITGHRLADVGHRGLFGEVERHQRLEAVGLGAVDFAPRHGIVQRRADALTIGRGLGHRGDGRLQVGHDDGAAHLPGTGGHHGLQGGTVAQMQVPVVGGAEGECVHPSMIVVYGADDVRPRVRMRFTNWVRMAS